MGEPTGSRAPRSRRTPLRLVGDADAVPTAVAPASSGWLDGLLGDVAAGRARLVIETSAGAFAVLPQGA